jgi:hypothetical protein
MPEPQLGHGIPDFMLAHDLLVMSIGLKEEHLRPFRIHPMPFTDRLDIYIEHEGLLEVTLFDLSGRMVWSSSGTPVTDGRLMLQDASLAGLGAGSYLLVLSDKTTRVARTIIKG